MKYTFCEKIIWYAMNGTIVDFLNIKHPNWNIKLIKSKAKKRYKQIIEESPDIGSITKNSLRTCLSSGALWLAFYETCEEKIKDEEFGEMVKATIKSPIIAKAFSSKNPFTKKAQLKKEKSIKKANEASNSEFNWKAEFIKGRDEEEYTIIYKQCGICALAKKENHPELVKYMCVLDTLSVDMFGGVLYRTKTLAEGKDCCDFYICKKDSHWNLQKEKNKCSHIPNNTKKE